MTNLFALAVPHIANVLIKAAHKKEFQASSISDDIIAANFESVGGDNVLEWLVEHKISQLGGHAQQYATAPIRRLYERLTPVVDNGWRGRGLDPLNHWEQMVWGCYKPDCPRDGWKKDRTGRWVKTNKPVKYEHPQGVQSRAFFGDIDPNDPSVGRTYWENVRNNKDIPILLTEGFKKSCCLLSAGYAAIALPGVSMWNKPKARELIAELELFAVEGRTFYIVFDQDTKLSTVRNVRAEIFKLSSAFRRKRCTVKIIEWDPKLGKGVDDLITTLGVSVFNDAYEKAVSYEAFAVRCQSELGFKPNWIAPTDIKYLTDSGLVNAIPDVAKLIAIKAPKGTGKTEVAKVIAHNAHEQGQRVLLLSHRIQLTTALAERVGVLSVYEMNDGGREQRELARAEVAANGTAMCVHSCHPESQARFNANNWTNALIIIDEASQVIWELLNSSTIRSQRVPILRELRTLLANALYPNSQGRVLLMDADLDRITLDAVRGIGEQPELEPWVAVSHYSESAYTCYVQEKPEAWLIDAEETLMSGHRLLVMTDSQQQKGRFSSIALEQRWSQKFPQLRLLRVDSETLSLKGHPAFGCINKANKVFAEYDVVICSPSVETGISLDLKEHFHAVYGCYQGVLSENSVRQSLARLRAPVDRIVYVAPRGLEVVGGGETWWRALGDSQDKKAKSILSQLFDAGRDNLRTNFLPAAVDAWSQYAARHNAGLATYRDVVIARLRDEGQTVIELGPSDDDVIKIVREETKGDRHQRLVDHGTAVCEADTITDADYEKQLEARSIETEQQGLEMERKALVNRYGVDPTLDLYMLDQYGWSSRLRLHYYLTIGRQHLRERDRNKIDELLESSQSNELWMPDVSRGSLSLKIAALEWLEVPKLLAMAETDEKIHADHELAIAISQKARDNVKALKLALGVGISQRHPPITIVRLVLEKVGYSLGKAQRRGPRGQQQRFYPVEQINTQRFKFSRNGVANEIEYSYSREAIFDQLQQRDKAAKTEKTMISVDNVQNACIETVTAVTTEVPVVTTGNRSSITTPNGYNHVPSNWQGVDLPVPIPDLTKREQICLEILQTIDNWGQYLSVAEALGKQLYCVWNCLTTQQQQVVIDLQPVKGERAG